MSLSFRLSTSLLALTSLLPVMASCVRTQPASPPQDGASDAVFVAATDPRIALMGRAVASGDGSLRFGYPGVTLRVAFAGPSLALRARSSSGNSRFAILVDEAPPQTLRVPAQTTDLTLAAGLGPGTHHVDIVHRTETWQGIVDVEGFVLAPGGSLQNPQPWPERRLLLIGDSVTSGEGVLRGPECSGDKAAGANAHDSYGMRLARALGAQVHLVSYGGRGLVRDWQGKSDVLNAPQFFQLSVAEDSPKVLWNHAAYHPDVIIVSLGTNDFNLALGAPPPRESYVATYIDFVRTLRGLYPAARVLLTEGAIVNDGDGTHPQKSTLRAYLEDVVRELGDAGVRYVPAHHYPGDSCDAHPTGEQHAAMAADLEPVVRELTGW